MSDFTLFKTFTDSESAQATVDTLSAAGIVVQIDDTRLLYSNALQQVATLPEVRVLVPVTELPRANALLEAEAAEAAEDIPEDHYLHQFTDSELLDLLSKPDEWSAHDYVWAQQLLAARGRPLRPAEVQALRFVRTEQLATYKSLPTGWLVAGWAMAALGGPLGIIVGWYFYTATTTLPNGQRVSTYAPSDQKQGLWMMGLGTVMFLLGITIRATNG